MYYTNSDDEDSYDSYLLPESWNRLINIAKQYLKSKRNNRRLLSFMKAEGFLIDRRAVKMLANFIERKHILAVDNSAICVIVFNSCSMNRYTDYISEAQFV